MNTISVLVIVDVEGALGSGSLNNYVWMVDTNGYVGSLGEGGSELQTACKDGQVIDWSVVPVAATTSVSISGFTGQMISSGVCNPVLIQAANGPYWEGRVESQGKTEQVQYSLNIFMEGTTMSFDPFLNITA